MVPVSEVVQLYSHAAVFACPSVYEPFGLINLEAMACETPVVASAVAPNFGYATFDRCCRSWAHVSGNGNRSLGANSM
jgi:hypothetical protein